MEKLWGRCLRRRCILLSPGRCWCMHRADSATITIDSFNYPDPGTTFYVPGEAPWGSGNPYDHKDAGVSEVIGGERDIHVEVVGSALPISAAGIIGYEPIYDSGAFLLATSGRAGTLAVAQYDGTAGGGLGGVDFTDGGTNKLFRLGFDTVDGGDGTSLPLTITVVGHAGGSTSVQTQVPANAAASDFDVPFVAFPDDVRLRALRSSATPPASSLSSTPWPRRCPM